MVESHHLNHRFEDSFMRRVDRLLDIFERYVEVRGREAQAAEKMAETDHDRQRAGR